MPTAIVQQQGRRQAIADLLALHSIQRQAELVRLLRAQGHDATQSSVSRDLRYLGAAKLRNGYSLPEGRIANNEETLELVAELVKRARRLWLSLAHM